MVIRASTGEFVSVQHEGDQGSVVTASVNVRSTDAVCKILIAGIIGMLQGALRRCRAIARLQSGGPEHRQLHGTTLYTAYNVDNVSCKMSWHLMSVGA